MHHILWVVQELASSHAQNGLTSPRYFALNNLARDSVGNGRINAENVISFNVFCTEMKLGGTDALPASIRLQSAFFFEGWKASALLSCSLGNGGV